MLMSVTRSKSILSKHLKKNGFWFLLILTVTKCFIVGWKEEDEYDFPEPFLNVIFYFKGIKYMKKKHDIKYYLIYYLQSLLLA